MEFNKQISMNNKIEFRPYISQYVKDNKLITAIPIVPKKIAEKPDNQISTLSLSPDWIENVEKAYIPPITINGITTDWKQYAKFANIETNTISLKNVQNAACPDKYTGLFTTVIELFASNKDGSDPTENQEADYYKFSDLIFPGDEDGVHTFTIIMDNSETDWYHKHGIENPITIGQSVTYGAALFLGRGHSTNKQVFDQDQINISNLPEGSELYFGGSGTNDSSLKSNKLSCKIRINTDPNLLWNSFYWIVGIVVAGYYYDENGIYVNNDEGNYTDILPTDLPETAKNNYDTMYTQILLIYDPDDQNPNDPVDFDYTPYQNDDSTAISPSDNPTDTIPST